ncbi:MAG: Hsp20 family protein [Pararhodobacter sp.]|nr:Hsp20 family protein [Pararhodobacter sp.]
MSKFAFPSHPLLLGFEPLERLVERTARAGAEGYPPFNIELSEPGRYTVTLAVAGFSANDLTITVEDRQLVIHGQQSDPGAERVFLHRGIANRQFRRVFALADAVEVTGAQLENGLLSVVLERREPESVVRRIPINQPLTPH